MSGQNKFSKINCGSCVRLYALAFKLPLEYMWEFYWFEFQDPSPSGLVANSRDTKIIHKKCQGKNGYFFLFKPCFDIEIIIRIK